MSYVRDLLIKCLILKHTITKETEWETINEIDGKAVIAEAKEFYGIDVTKDEIIRIGDELNG